MIANDDRNLLMMEPILDKDGEVYDEVVEKLKSVWHLKEAFMHLMGTHTCICGERSDTGLWMLHGMETNSLALHYLIHHRYEVPEEDIARIMALPGPENVTSFQEANDDRMCDDILNNALQWQKEGFLKMSEAEIRANTIRRREMMRKDRAKAKNG